MDQAVGVSHQENYPCTPAPPSLLTIRKDRVPYLNPNGGDDNA